MNELVKKFLTLKTFPFEKVDVKKIQTEQIQEELISIE